jgi:hypothetical protein
VFLWDLIHPCFVLSFNQQLFYILQFEKNLEDTCMMLDYCVGNVGRLDYLLHEHYLGNKRNSDGFSHPIK